MDNDAIYQKAIELEQVWIGVCAVTKTPELVYPAWNATPPLPDLAAWDTAAAVAYFDYLAVHRAELGSHPKFGVEYRLLDDLAAENRSIAELSTGIGERDDQPDTSATSTECSRTGREFLHRFWASLTRSPARQRRR